MRHHAPETRPVPGLPGYYVTTDGRFLSTRAGRHHRPPRTPLERTTCLQAEGRYRIVHAQRDGRQVVRYLHHAILLAFVGPRPRRARAQFRDGDRSNVRVDNLAWVTAGGLAYFYSTTDRRVLCRRRGQWSRKPRTKKDRAPYGRMARW
jgi:hypothetical protein